MPGHTVSIEEALHIEHVLDGEWYAMQQPELVQSTVFLSLLCLFVAFLRQLHCLTKILLSSKAVVDRQALAALAE